MSNAPTTTSRSVEVLAVARRLLVEEGLDNFVMRRIAHLAGMKLGNLQYYFPTRDDLLEAILLSEFDNDLAALHASNPTGDPAPQLRKAVRFLLDRWLNGEGNVYASIGALSLHHERFERLWAEIYQQFYAVLGRLIEQIDPAASAQQIQLRATLITSLIDGATIQPYDPAAGRTKADIAREIERLAAKIAQGT